MTTRHSGEMAVGIKGAGKALVGKSLFQPPNGERTPPSAAGEESVSDSIGAPVQSETDEAPAKGRCTGFCIWHPRTKLRTFSDAAAAIFAERAVVLNGMSNAAFIERFVHPDDQVKVAGAYDALIRDRAPFDISYRMFRPDGSLRRVRETGDAMPSRRGKSAPVLGNIIDITARTLGERASTAARERAIYDSWAKSLFLSKMSHELRTPLNAIIGFSEMIQSEIHGSLGDPRYRQYVMDICESGQHLLKLVNNVLDLTRIEAGRHRIFEEEIDLGRLIVDASRNEISKLDSRAVEPNLELVAGPLRLTGDARLVKQAVLNLLSNAFKFSLGVPRIRIVAGRETDRSLYVTIEDRGPGMSKEELHDAMEPFGQVNGTLVSQRGGAGLGLTFARMVMRQHQGTLSVRSEPGQGTAVTLHFPPQRTIQA